MNDFIYKWVCEGVDVGLDSIGRFVAIEQDRTFETFAKLREFIDNKAKADASKDRKKVAIDVLSTTGKAAKITGIHFGTGRMTTSPKVTANYGADVAFPATTWIAEAIGEVDKLQTRVRHIQHILEVFEIRVSNSGYVSTPSGHEAAVTALIARAERVKKLADATTLEEQLVKVPVPAKARL